MKLLAFALVVAMLVTTDGAGATTAAPDASPTTSPTPAPPTIIPIDDGGHAIYVIATGTDAATRARVIASEALRLSSLPLTAALIPEPDWTLADYITACGQGKGNVDGALILGLVANYNGNDDIFVFRRSWTHIAAVASYSKCKPAPSDGADDKKAPSIAPTPTPTPTPTATAVLRNGATPEEITINVRVVNAAETASASPKPSPSFIPVIATNDIGKVHEDGGNSFSLNPAVLISVLVASVAGYVAFVPQKTTSTVSVQNYPTPIPLPRDGSSYPASISTTTGSTANGSSLGSLATGFAPSALSNTASLTPAADTITIRAINHLVFDMTCDIHKFSAFQAAPADTSCPK